MFCTPGASPTSELAKRSPQRTQTIAATTRRLIGSFKKMRPKIAVSTGLSAEIGLTRLKLYRAIAV